MDGPMTDELAHESEQRHDQPVGASDGIGRRHLAWLAVLVLVLVAVTVIDGPARHALRDMGLVDRDERFTELYFPDHLVLPDRATAGESPAFQFSVRNREGATRTYEWQVVIGPPEAPTSGGAIASGELRLGDDEIRVVDVPPVDLRDAGLPAGGHAVVTVALVGRREAIHFPLVVGSPDAGAATASP